MHSELVALNQCSITDLPEPYKQYADLIGIENLYYLAKEWGGTSIYIPKPQFLFKEVLTKQIIQEFDGSNYHQLARKYSVCERTIRNIIKERGR
jgi:Mor family transcriptional regulator